jgi:hypothetical protein
MITKFGVVNDGEIKMKLEAICQEPHPYIATYLSKLEKYFHKGQIAEVEQ